MVLLLKVATMRFFSADGWNLAHFGTLIYSNGDLSTNKRKTVIPSTVISL